MPGVCGLACEVCRYLDQGNCMCGSEDGCKAGTDPKAINVLQGFEAKIGYPCPVLKCAIDKRVDYCFRCNDFPCEKHDGFIYHQSFLDWVRKTRQQ